MTDIPISEDDPHFNRIGANYEVQFATHLRDKSMDQAISMGAWLVASLLALNGGGAIAVLNSLKHLSDPIYPAGLFIAGIMLALANAAAVQRCGYAALKPMSEMIGYWLTVAEDGERLLDFENDLKRKMRPLRFFGLVASMLGWISSALFLAGCISFAINMEEPPEQKAMQAQQLAPPGEPTNVNNSSS